MAVLPAMPSRRHKYNQREPIASSLPATLHPLMYNEPVHGDHDSFDTDDDDDDPSHGQELLVAAMSSTSAARSTLHESRSFPLRAPRLSPEYDHPHATSLSVPHSRPPLTAPDRQHSPHYAQPGPYVYSPQPSPIRRAGSYPRQPDSPEYPPSDVSRPSPYSHYDYPSSQEILSLPRIPPPSSSSSSSTRRYPDPSILSASSGRQGLSDEEPPDRYPTPPSRSHRRLPQQLSDDDDYYKDPPPPLPSAKRARVPKKVQVACNFCRGRKLRCDGSRPSCWNCTSRQIRCEYVEVLKRRGPGKTPKSQAATQTKKRPSGESSVGTKSPLPSPYTTLTFNPDLQRPLEPSSAIPGPSQHRSPSTRGTSHDMTDSPPPQQGPSPRSSFAPGPPPFSFSQYRLARNAPPVLPPLQTQGLHPSSFPAPAPTHDPSRRLLPLPRRSGRTRMPRFPATLTDSDEDNNGSKTGGHQ